MSPLWHIIERHLDEAEFLLDVRHDCLDAPDYTLEELAVGPEARALAHLEGLVAAGSSLVERMLLPELGSGQLEASRACALALTLLQVGAEPQWDLLLEVLDTSVPGEEMWAGVVRGLELGEGAGLDEWLSNRLTGNASPARVAGLANVACTRGLNPGDCLEGLLRSEDPFVCAAGARLARNCEDLRRVALVGPLAQHAESRVQHAALETGLIRGLRGSWASALYWAFTERLCDFRRVALTWVAMLGDQDCQRRLLSLLAAPELAADALWALGFGGRVEAVDAAVRLLDHEELGQLAGELVCAIAGAPTEDESLWLPAPAGESMAELPPLEDDLSTKLDEEPEDRLPRPNPEALAAWWASRRGELAGASRRLCGGSWSVEQLRCRLREAPLRRRHQLALELRIRSHGSQHVNTRDWTSRQRSQMTCLELGAVTLTEDLPASGAAH